MFSVWKGVEQGQRKGMGPAERGGPVCRAFQTTEEGMQYCEEQFLAVAARHNLCRPSSSVLTLEDILSLHSSLVLRPHSIFALRMPLCVPSGSIGPAHAVLWLIFTGLLDMKFTSALCLHS
jgi:hypothetical protein